MRPSAIPLSTGSYIVRGRPRRVFRPGSSEWRRPQKPIFGARSVQGFPFRQAHVRTLPLPDVPSFANAIPNTLFADMPGTTL
jgi:hypothetical protein